MIPYQITIPTEKKTLNQKMQLLAMGSGVWYTIDRTENDTVYNIEFELQNEFDLFKETVEKAIPELTA
jgi:hypothetical protein